MSVFDYKFRITTDTRLGYTVQGKPWWFPWFITPENAPSFMSFESALFYIKQMKEKYNHKPKVLYEE